MGASVSGASLTIWHAPLTGAGGERPSRHMQRTASLQASKDERGVVRRGRDAAGNCAAAPADLEPMHPPADGLARGGEARGTHAASDVLLAWHGPAAPPAGRRQPSKWAWQVRDPSHALG